jgi:flagellar export protein FliJ
MRTRQLEEVQQRFAVQMRRVVEIQTLIQETQDQIQQYLNPQKPDAFDPIISQQRFRFVQYLKLQLDFFQRTLQQEEIKLNALREEMRLAHVKKKSLEQLEENQRKTFLKALEEQESKEIEDLVMARRHYFNEKEEIQAVPH